METLIDDLPLPQGDWNKPHEDSKASPHRRRRKKEKAKSEHSPAEFRRQEKVETLIDDPPTNPDREQKTDDPPHQPSKQEKKRRKDEHHEEPSASRRRHGQEELSPQTRERARTYSPKSPKRHKARSNDDQQPLEDDPPSPRRRRKTESGSTTSPGTEHRSEEMASTTQQSQHQNNEAMPLERSRTKDSSTAPSPDNTKHQTPAVHDDAATQQTKPKKEKKKKKKAEKAGKEQIPKQAKETTKRGTDIDTVQQPSTEVKETAEIDPRQHQRPNREKFSASPQRSLQEIEEKKKEKTPGSPQHRSQETEEKEKESTSHRKLEARKEKVSQSSQQSMENEEKEKPSGSLNHEFDETEKKKEKISDSPQQRPQEKEAAKKGAVDRPGPEWSGDEDLNPENRRLSDFKELCKSVASLLQIENQEAAAMLTEPLSGRRDLVEGLDAEAIFDYLTQHGVLDTHTLQSLRSSPAVTQRNAALLQHVEREGHNAVALFINALRQSGQLHLASSLDNERRIQPVSEGDYFEKQRHKGEVTIIIKVHALLIVVPERDSEGDVIDSSMLASPRGIHQSYDNMLMMDDEPVVVDATDDEEDSGRKKSFFCFCFPSRAKKQKEKKYTDQMEMKSQSRSGKPGNNDGAHKERNGAWSARSSAVSSPQHSSRQVEPPDVLFSGDSRRNSGSPKKEWGVEQGDQKNGVKEWREAGENKHNKENTDPVIMEYNKQMELIRLKAQKQRDRTRTTSQSSAIVMCQKWKSGGQYFRKKLMALCEQFEFDLQTYIIKYIEQDRGTLVLSVWTDRHTMFVSNICMTKQQVRQLHKDLTTGVLRERFDALLRTNQCLQKLDILDMDLRIVIDDDQFQQALRELAA